MNPITLTLIPSAMVDGMNPAALAAAIAKPGIAAAPAPVEAPVH